MDKKYFAFISYKREDEKQAEWLRRKLEAYHLPAKLRKENSALPKTVRPIFRDSLELSGGFLAKEIETALSNSKYLIVICSPKSAGSPWVNKEVQYFIDHGREEYIIPYIIDGVPFSNELQTECYPPALRALSGDNELLGINLNEMGRDAAAVKVVARMFGLGFDTLWQRYNREQRRKRIGWGVFAALLIILSFIFIAWLKGVNNELEERQNKLLISQSKYLASEAQREYDKGNITKALRMALYALPKDLENPDRPYIPETDCMLRRTANSQIVSTYKNSRISESQSTVFSFSPDGKYYAIIDGRSVNIYENNTGKQIGKPLVHENDVNFFEFSPDGRNILTISSIGTICLWDVKIGNVIMKKEYDNIVKFATFSQDGNYFIVTLPYVFIADICKTSSGETIIKLKHGETVRSALYSPIGRYVSTVTDKSVYVWDVDNGDSLCVSNNLKERSPVIFSPDGRSIMILQENDTVVIWDIIQKKQLCMMKQYKYAHAPSFSSDGRYTLTQPSSNTAVLWDVKTAKQLKEFNNIDYALFSPVGTSFVTKLDSDTIRFYNAETLKQAALPISCSWSINETISFSADGRYIISMSYNNAYVWDVLLGKKIAGPLEHDRIEYALFSHDENYIVTISDDFVRVWNISLNNEKDYLKHNSDVVSVVCSPDGKYIVTASSDNTARVWDARTGEPVTEPLKHEDDVISAVFSPDGKYIVTASADNTARVWYARSGEQVTEPLKHEGDVISAIFRPDGKYIVTASWDNTARVWDVKTGKPVTEPLKHEKDVNSAVFSPDGKYIVTASWDNTARVWDARTGKTVTEPLKHEDDVNSAVFSPDGKYIVTASDDNTARVWDARTWKPVTEPLKHEGDVISAVFSPDGKYIVTASRDNTACVWSFPPLQELLDKYNKDPEHDWSLSEEEKEEYSLE